MNEPIIYEQPLNEVIRVALRLELLFSAIDHLLHDTSAFGSREILNLIMNVLHILDRPDFKAKLAKELSHHRANLMRFSENPDIDKMKCKELIAQIDTLNEHLIESDGKIGQNLRDIELLSHLRLQLATPGGGCDFDLPLFHYWLEQPQKLRETMIQSWLSKLSEIKTAISLTLELVRKNAKIQEKIAIHGFYQELLDPQSHMRMIRILLPNDLAAYPQISIGRHFLSLRFFNPDINKKPTQYLDNLPFSLAYCSS